eukprot:TRINITY_DN11133_c0_g1_i1.p2 TRINITY_DN11133_c0_g1~~TRINITY_DN11133_c0_g1_i1.p2  ORF type:complete len:250 (+),score=70.30 TRINITY_DN11133_c0_g1_i1:80-829(+)
MRARAGGLPALLAAAAASAQSVQPGSVAVRIYSDRGCSSLLYRAAFAHVDGTCEQPALDGDPGGKLPALWGAAQCDLQNSVLHIQTGFASEKDCQQAGPVSRMAGAYAAPLTGPFHLTCNTWLMRDPKHASGAVVELSVAVALDPGSCATQAPTPAPTPPPTPPPPAATCGAWPAEAKYGCGGGSGGWTQLSRSKDEVACQVACRDKATQEQAKQLCCYLGGNGCYALDGGSVTHNSADNGRAMLCGVR